MRLCESVNYIVVVFVVVIVIVFVVVVIVVIVTITITVTFFPPIILCFKLACTKMLWSFIAMSVVFHLDGRHTGRVTAKLLDINDK